MVDLLTGIATGSTIGTDTLTSIEAAIGSRFNDSITLSNAAAGYATAAPETTHWSAVRPTTASIRVRATTSSWEAPATTRSATIDDGSDGAGPITQGIFANLATGTVFDGWGNTDTLTGIENINGTDLADQITGDALNNTSGATAATTSLAAALARTTSLVARAMTSSTAGPMAPSATWSCTARRSSGLRWPRSSAPHRTEKVVTDTITNVESIQDSAFNDVLTGTSGSNFFRLGAGNDTVDGGGGSDAVSYESATAGVTVNLLTGVATGSAIGTDALTSIEAAHGSWFDDSITLSNAEDTYSAAPETTH